MERQQQPYLIEFRQVGNWIRVSAVDPVSYHEASIAVPAGKKISKKDMERLAVRKLEYVISKKKREQAASPAKNQKKSAGKDLFHIDQTI